MVINITNFYVTPTGNLVLCTKTGSPLRSDSMFKRLRPIEQLTPTNLRTPLDMVRLKSTRVRYRYQSNRGMYQLTKTLYNVFKKAGYATLYDLLVASYATPAVAAAGIDKMVTCSDGNHRIHATIKSLLKNPGSDILSANYEPRVYLDIDITQVPLPVDFPNVFNGAGIPTDVMKRLRVEAEEYLGKVIGKMLIETARKVETDRIALANKRLAKLASLV